MGKIINRFKILLAEKEVKDGRSYSYRAIQEVTGIAASTLSALANNNTTRYDAGTLAALCDFFGCQPGALLVYEPGKAARD
jgi:putative transcriptional regulator